MVLTAKVAGIFRIDVADVCLDCIYLKAQENVSMDKMDTIGIGYTQAALDEGALQLMMCPSCNKYRDYIMMSKPKEFCASCFTYFMYQNS
jgi:hypothetical protein